MRYYLFRGKRKGVGEWVYGNLLHTETRGGIGTFTMFYEVYPETVGQYIGLDLNGTKIFEGDILKDNKRQYGHVCFSNGAFVVNWHMKDGTWETDRSFVGTVAGNIHDNPELLESNK